jgi:hypothetical protein
MPWSQRSNTKTRELGYVNAVTGAVQHFQMSRTTAKAIAKSLEEVAARYQGWPRVCVVWDNWPVHAHETVVAALARHPTLEILPLPTYAPWLNPIEKMWRKGRQEVAHAHPDADDLPTFRAKLKAHFDQYAGGSPALLHYIGLSP